MLNFMSAIRVPSTLENVFDLFEEFPLDNETYPKINIIEKEEEVDIITVTPSFEKKDLEVSYKNGILCIKGDAKQEEQLNYIRREFKKASFVRNISLNEKALDMEKITTVYKNGELRVQVPKKKETIEKERPKRILIN